MGYNYIRMRKTEFANGEFYHIYNRGVDKRQIVFDQSDSDRFIKSLIDFNSLEPIGSIYEHSFEKNLKPKDNNLVNIICYCLNSNHYHLLLEQLADGGIEKFLHRLGMGYSKYFNNKYKRGGALWQGPFRSVYVGDNDYLLHLSAYINLNPEAHQLGHSVSKLVRTSWGEYIGKSNEKICQTKIILEQFQSRKDYRDFAQGALELIKDNKLEIRELDSLGHSVSK